MRKRRNTGEKKERGQKELRKPQHRNTLHAVKLSMPVDFLDAPRGHSQ